ncbi:hypothetical protein H072_2362 [Dactylellina haptotyla CBS 200.50]|uniref:Uncharacterized protein n=1 Tax=Dactylellina haptotyla (strain CBS 200.50) TaxID=1284197 RepID=S8AKS8_DACHA|nr:hypothetical protein H072_2362 [Dactylellina haptotyla CBS 200.50]
MAILIPFLLHSLLELPPSFILLFSPLSFIPPLPQPTRQEGGGAIPSKPEADLNAALIPIFRQYGAILLSSSIFSFLLSITPNEWVLSPAVGTISGNWTVHEVSALALAGYHVLTVNRACGRIATGETPFVIGKKRLGGPGLHVIVHSVVGSQLIWYGLAGF